MRRRGSADGVLWSFSAISAGEGREFKIFLRLGAIPPPSYGWHGRAFPFGHGVGSPPAKVLSQLTPLDRTFFRS